MDTTPDILRLKGIEKAAVLFLCLQEEQGSSLMAELDDEDIHALTSTMSTLGTIPAAAVEQVIQEFTAAVQSGGIIGSVDAAQRILTGLLTDSAVSDGLAGDDQPQRNAQVWDSFSSLNDQVIANHLRGEMDQTVAAILTHVRPQVAARTLPHFGQERMVAITRRMISIEPLPREMLRDIEEWISSELLSSAVKSAGSDTHQRMADVFNKMDQSVFEDLSRELEACVPQAFQQIKQKMFVFDDLARFSDASLQRISRSCEGNTLALALRGAKKHVRDAFLNVTTQRAREILQGEIEAMGPVRARDARDAQAQIIDITLELLRLELIHQPSDEDEMI
ncbi:flagellar motor switch protein FliG [Paracoccus ravus]|uniref:flagellar motor switch protein FliG n=1 Tax=Paracoccus ravus TaxID=2447760 RepID=UPI00106E0BCD|nr:FliG C-terminal domain-containing protein [Paracoccus ravus]